MGCVVLASVLDTGLYFFFPLIYCKLLDCASLRDISGGLESCMIYRHIHLLIASRTSPLPAGGDGLSHLHGAQQLRRQRALHPFGAVECREHGFLTLVFACMAHTASQPLWLQRLRRCNVGSHTLHTPFGETLNTGSNRSMPAAPGNTRINEEDAHNACSVLRSTVQHSNRARSTCISH
jgi:hypothetical protein